MDPFLRLGFGMPAGTVGTAECGARSRGGTASGIKGIVTDASGGVLPKANVVAEDAEKGIRRSTVTDSGGSYLLTGLPPGIYNVSVEIAGFGTEIKQGLVVTVGQTGILDFHLKVASVKETVEVSADLPTVDTEKSSQSNTMTEVLIKDLPIDRRDYLTFSLLAPGVSNSTRLADDTDYRVKQFSSSGLSFYGSNGRGNSVTVDGGEANDDEGGVRLTLGQDAVQEFQINRSNYGADMGGASGATINIVSKSGTDDLHGSAFGFFRDGAMDARDPFAFSPALAPDPTFSNFNTDSFGEPIKNSLSRQQYGGAVGFPITKNRTFLFASFEGLRQNSQNSVPLLTDSSIFAGPSITGIPPCQFCRERPEICAAANSFSSCITSEVRTSVPCTTNPDGSPATPIPAASCAQLLQDFLTINPNAGFLSQQNQLVEGFLVSQLENNGGVFPYDTRQYLASARLDHRISDNDQVFLRYNYGHDLVESPDVQSLTGYSRGSSVHAYNDTLLASWFHLFSPRTRKMKSGLSIATTMRTSFPTSPLRWDLTFSASRIWERTSFCRTTRCCGATTLPTTLPSPRAITPFGSAGKNCCAAITLRPTSFCRAALKSGQLQEEYCPRASTRRFSGLNACGLTTPGRQSELAAGVLVGGAYDL